MQGLFEDAQQQEENQDLELPLPSDLIEHLERRKQQRLQVIETTEKVKGFMVGWSLNATGYCLARWLLFIGGSTNLWIAVTLCFAIASTSGFANLSGLNARYSQGLEVEGGEKIIGFVTSVGTSGGVTFLAVKDFIYFQGVSDATITDIKNDIQSIEQSPNLWGSPWALGGGILILFILAMKVFKNANR